MHATASFSRRFRFLRLLAANLLAGAAYDLGFAVLMVAAPGVPMRVLSLPLPGERVLPADPRRPARHAGRFLYAAAARDPRRYSAIIAVAIAGRIVGGLAMALAPAASRKLATTAETSAPCNIIVGKSPMIG